MIDPEILKHFYFQNRVPNPVNVTFTEKQYVDGEWIDDPSSEQNFRHFSNKLNAAVYRSKFKRYGLKLAMFVVRESDGVHRHHLHCIIERPTNLSKPLFALLIKNCWHSTRFGHEHVHIEFPEAAGREQGWVEYCLKRRSKALYSDSIDWSNSTCFELR
ncbi:hypothetical protein LSUCC1028_00345 [Rhodobacterales bacterium LSUCC1028]|nr:hypothetical protein [Rhodobacterales bacterium LSUCC1028]